jgi:hypothetical protein
MQKTSSKVSLAGSFFYKTAGNTSPEGIEPPSQEPESYVISITPRRHATFVIIADDGIKFKHYF